jgi:hypothetical protein
MRITVTSRALSLAIGSALSSLVGRKAGTSLREKGKARITELLILYDDGLQAMLALEPP